MMASRLTDPRARAVIALRDAVEKDRRSASPARFAMFMWPGEEFARGNGPWGLGPDASGRHGGRMLTTLLKLGLARFHYHHGYYTAELSPEGLRVPESVDSGTGA